MHRENKGKCMNTIKTIKTRTLTTHSVHSQTATLYDESLIIHDTCHKHNNESNW